MQKKQFKVIQTRRAQLLKSFNSLDKIKVVLIGCGPIGLRTAIELALLGAHVTVVERRKNPFTRHNILHLWDWVCADLLALGIRSKQ